MKLRVRRVDQGEREFRLRIPFRFGAFTLTEAPQIFVRVEVELESGGTSNGLAAEVLAPKWFDKNPDLSNEENFEQLRTALRLAAELYLDVRHFTLPFELFERCYRSHIEACRARDLNPLIAGFGPALLDRAVLDALCRRLGVSIFEAVRRNLFGIRSSPLFSDLEGFDFDGFLKRLSPLTSIHARHTVGLIDPLSSGDRPASERVDDGLPETLEEVVATYGNRYFKVKLSGKLEDDLQRLGAIAGVLDRKLPTYCVTLDGNEQFSEVDGLLELMNRIHREPVLKRFRDSILFVEQPFNRVSALNTRIPAGAIPVPVIVDESDAELDSFLVARRLGYGGVSSKACKGFYKSLVNRARCRQWNSQAGDERFLMSAEDLTTQAGVSLQQDLAIIALLQLEHAERNGHHYVRGMAGASRAEQKAFLEAHPDLYEDDGTMVRLRVEGGQLKLASLSCPGFACGALPDWSMLKRRESFPG